MQHRGWLAILALAFIASIGSIASFPRPATAAGAQAVTTAKIAGTLVSQINGLPVGDASVTLYRGNTVVASATSDSAGSYAFSAEAGGEYSIVVRVTGYQSTRITGVFATNGTTTTVRTPLLPAQTNAAASGGLREIGQTSASIRGNTLASSSTMQHDLSPDKLQAQGFLNAAAAIGNVPGINLSGGQHSAGDDTFIDIRGMGQGEVRPLVDGHPIGPIGVFSTDYYDYANSPYFLLQNIQTTVGSGAAGLYGVDVIGGTIDFQTLEPTAAAHGEFYQGVGNQGVGITEVKASGSIGRLGYALGHTVQGAYNDFEPGLRFQDARPNNNLNLPNGGAFLPGAANNRNGYPDVTTGNRILNTYSVSGNYLVHNDLAKLRYNFTDATALTLSAYAGNQLSDSTGNGDNDNLPYDTRLAEVKTAKPQCGNGGYFAVTNYSNSACLSAQTLAAVSYGPDGGGQNRNRGTTLQDYHARLTTTIAHNAFTADVFRDFYQFRKDSSQAAGLDPSATFFNGGGTFADDYLTNGLLLSDEIAGQKNDFGAGYFVEHQRRYGNTFIPATFGSAATTTSPAVAGTAAYFLGQPEVGEGDYSFFVRDQFVANDHFTAYVNAWSRRSNVTQKTTFDPRVSLVFKPTGRDIVRLTAGRADGDPSASIKSNGLFTNINNASSLNPSCTLLNSIANSGNPALSPESANDAEASYGHRFWSDTSVNLVGYVSSERNALFNGVVPISSFGTAGIGNPAIAGVLPSFAQKIQSACPSLGALNATTVIPYLGITTTFNAASAFYRGLELNGRLRVAPIFYVDYDYNVQSSRQTGIPVSILTTNPLLINDAQIYEIPVHKGSLTLDYNDLHGVEAQLQGYYTGPNNDLNRGGYTFFNAFVSKALGHSVRATLGADNVFDQNVALYGYFGHQLTAPVNQYAPAALPALAGFPSNVQQAATLGNSSTNELIGLPPRLITFSLSASM